MATPNWRESCLIGIDARLKQEWVCRKCDKRCTIILNLGAEAPAKCPASHEE